MGTPILGCDLGLMMNNMQPHESVRLAESGSIDQRVSRGLGGWYGVWHGRQRATECRHARKQANRQEGITCALIVGMEPIERLQRFAAYHYRDRDHQQVLRPEKLR